MSTYVNKNMKAGLLLGVITYLPIILDVEHAFWLLTWPSLVNTVLFVQLRLMAVSIMIAGCIKLTYRPTGSNVFRKSILKFDSSFCEKLCTFFLG